MPFQINALAFELSNIHQKYFKESSDLTKTKIFLIDAFVSAKAEQCFFLLPNSN